MVLSENDRDNLRVNEMQGRNLAYELQNYLYYTIDEKGIKRCFIICGSTHMVTYRHGSHMKYEENNEIEVFCFNEPNKSKKVKVVKISEISYDNKNNPLGDFIMLESMEGKFEHYPMGIEEINMYMGYIKIGLDNKGERVFDRGVIHKKAGVSSFEGSTLGEKGNSGAGIFTPYGKFAGIIGYANTPKLETKTGEIIGIPRDLIISSKEICNCLERNDPAFASSSPLSAGSGEKRACSSTAVGPQEKKTRTA